MGKKTTQSQLYYKIIFRKNLQFTKLCIMITITM